MAEHGERTGRHGLTEAPLAPVLSLRSAGGRTTGAASPGAAPSSAGPRWRARPTIAVGVPLLVGLVHVALVAPHYFVGSFDDDASYLLAAKALASGHGLTTHLSNGTVMAGLFPPGYSALLAPFVWLWPHTYAPERLLSTACYAGIFPLLWVYLGRRAIRESLRTATLLLLALGPPLATYGSMVMAETPYLVLLLVLLLLVDRWEGQPKVWTATGAGVVVVAGALVWSKEAGVGAVAGLVLWYLLRAGSRAKGLFVAGGVAVVLSPVVAARLLAHVPLAGSRYSQELGGYYHGGLVDRLVHVVPQAFSHLLSTALPATLIPYLSPWPINAHWPDLWKVVSWQVTILCAVGAVVWWRRHRDASLPIAGVYLAETLLWPYINERRVILVLPLLAAWYAVGAHQVWTWGRDRWRPVPARAAGAAFAALLILVPLVAQAPRDYLFGWNQHSSHFAGSRYVSLLSALTPPSSVVETDYVSSTALYTGHRTAATAFDNSVNSCDDSLVQAGIAADDAGFLLVGAVNKPGLLDSPCIYGVAADSDWAVPLMHSTRDLTTVFELIGPGTGHPDLANLLSRATTTSGPTELVWQWATPHSVSQVSVGEAAVATGATTAVQVQLETGPGTWRTVATANEAVGDGAHDAPFLLASLPAGTTATGLRVMVDGPAGAGIAADDVVALGRTGP